MNIISRFLRSSEPGEDKKYTKDGILLLLCRVIILGVTILYIMKSFIGTYYHEIDSYVLPTISIEYRHSFIITQEDIDRAKLDYPQYYEDVEDYDSLRCSRLVKVTEDEWVSFYFPSYSICCMPLKLILQLVGADQAWAFTVTNALFVIAALIYMYNKLKVPSLFRLLAVLMFVLSPIDLYIQYVSAEAMMFSLVTIALVMYSNRQYHISALLISVASMTNPTVMGFGIVMVLAYLVKMFRNHKQVHIFSKQNILATLKYACCFLPCFIPFIFNAIVLGSGNPTAGGATLTDYGARVLSYLFDVNLGFFSFAPLTLVVFLVLFAISLINKDFSVLTWGGFLLFPLLAYSLMIHINCSMILCARYVMWNYPALFIGISILCSRVLKKDVSAYMLSISMTAVTAAMLVINSSPMYYFGFNRTAQFLLDYFPGLYMPAYSTFYAGTDQLNWSYDVDFPSYYYSRHDGTLRKLLFKSTYGYKSEVLSSVTGSSEDMEKFREIVNNIPSDEKFHYINISPFSGIKLWKKTSEDIGLVKENKTILEVNNRFTVSEEISEFKFEHSMTDQYTLCKLEIEFANGDDLTHNIDFGVDVMNYHIVRESFTWVNENTIVVLFPVEKEQAEKYTNIKFNSNRDVEIKSFYLKTMASVNTLILPDTPVKLVPGETDIYIPVRFDLKPMKHYFLDIKLSDESLLTANDDLYCTLDYDKRFTLDLDDFQITDNQSRFLVYIWDTTTATGPVYVRVYGETDEPLTIEYAALSIAE